MQSAWLDHLFFPILGIAPWADQWSGYLAALGSAYLLFQAVPFLLIALFALFLFAGGRGSGRLLIWCVLSSPLRWPRYFFEILRLNFWWIGFQFRRLAVWLRGELLVMRCHLLVAANERSFDQFLVCYRVLGFFERQFQRLGFISNWRKPKNEQAGISSSVDEADQGIDVLGEAHEWKVKGKTAQTGSAKKRVKRFNFPGGKLAVAVCALAAAAFLLAGCTSGPLQHFDRTYVGATNTDFKSYGGEILWSPAANPGQGKASFGLRVTGGKAVLAPVRERYPNIVAALENLNLRKGFWF